MIRLLKLLGNIVDPSWWTDLIGEKSGAYDRARKPNKFKEWKLKQPLWKQFFIEVLMFTLIALAFEPLLNMLGCLLYTSPSPRDATLSRMPSSA